MRWFSSMSPSSRKHIPFRSGTRIRLTSLKLTIVEAPSRCIFHDKVAWSPDTSSVDGDDVFVRHSAQLSDFILEGSDFRLAVNDLDRAVEDFTIGATIRSFTDHSEGTTPKVRLLENRGCLSVLSDFANSFGVATYKYTNRCFSRQTLAVKSSRVFDC